MLAADRPALICDMAETYGILDIYSVPAELLATFAVGLRGDSRIKMKLAGARVSPEILLIAGAVDRLSLLVWAQTEDARQGRNRPKSIVKALTGEDMGDTDGILAFGSPEEFLAERERILKGGQHGDGTG